MALSCRFSCKHLGPSLKSQSGRQDSNLRPSAPKAPALPSCATPRRANPTARNTGSLHRLNPCESSRFQRPLITPRPCLSACQHGKREPGRLSCDQHQSVGSSWDPREPRWTARTQPTHRPRSIPTRPTGWGGEMSAAALGSPLRHLNGAAWGSAATIRLFPAPALTERKQK